MGLHDGFLATPSSSSRFEGRRMTNSGSLFFTSWGTFSYILTTLSSSTEIATRTRTQPIGLRLQFSCPNSTEIDCQEIAVLRQYESLPQI